MNTHLSEIASRIKALREILELNEQDVAKQAGISAEDYSAIEAGKKDFSVSLVIRLAEIFKVDSTDLLTGKSPTLSTYTLTRKGQGLSVARREGFEYKNLAHNFKNKAAEPFVVTAPYIAEEQDKPIALSTHAGQEMDMVISGSLKIVIGNKEEILNEGDSIYYNSSVEHGMIAAGGKPCVFLAVVIR